MYCRILLMLFLLQEKSRCGNSTNLTGKLKYLLIVILILLWLLFYIKVPIFALVNGRCDSCLFLVSGFSHSLSTVRTRTQELLTTLFFLHSPNNRYGNRPNVWVGSIFLIKPHVASPCCCTDDFCCRFYDDQAILD